MITLDGNHLSIADIVAIGNGRKHGVLDPNVLIKCQPSRAYLLEQIRDGKIIYGVNSSFGSMCNKIINDDVVGELQEKLI